MKINFIKNIAIQCCLIPSYIIGNPDVTMQKIAGVLYMGNISAAGLQHAVDKLRYDLDLATRAIYPFTTINTAGFYRLAADVSNQITISASNVTLDLNGHTIS